MKTKEVEWSNRKDLEICNILYSPFDIYFLLSFCGEQSQLLRFDLLKLSHLGRSQASFLSRSNGKGKRYSVSKRILSQSTTGEASRRRCCWRCLFPIIAGIVDVYVPISLTSQRDGATFFAHDVRCGCWCVRLEKRRAGGVISNMGKAVSKVRVMTRSRVRMRI